MKSAHYNTSGPKGAGHLLVVYDETALCLLCELPVISASVGGTAICGWCDCGKPRQEGATAFRQNFYRRRPEGEKINPWANVTEQFFFDTREEADRRMYELHQEGIEGFPHVVERLSASESTGG